ncbi:hypothetical protein NCCP2165_20700 [Halomonas sp. NCCP-2165]|nr:hypothetical protein NCCP2165_20700 [Halomonas sp. NCCP-2165]
MDIELTGMMAAQMAQARQLTGQPGGHQASVDNDAGAMHHGQPSAAGSVSAWDTTPEIPVTQERRPQGW